MGLSKWRNRVRGSRVRACWNCLLGRPTIYGVYFVPPVEGEVFRFHESMNTPGTLIAACRFDYVGFAAVVGGATALGSRGA